MGKFLNTISSANSATLRNRAAQLNTQAKIAQEAIIADLRNRKALLEVKIQDLTDLAPDTTDSLRPSVRDWNPKKWASELQDVKVQLYELNVNLEIAENTLEEFFGDDDTDVAPEEIAE